MILHIETLQTPMLVLILIQKYNLKEFRQFIKQFRKHERELGPLTCEYYPRLQVLTYK